MRSFTRALASRLRTAAAGLVLWVIGVLVAFALTFGFGIGRQIVTTPTVRIDGSELFGHGELLATTIALSVGAVALLFVKPGTGAPAFRVAVGVVAMMVGLSAAAFLAIVLDAMHFAPQTVQAGGVAGVSIGFYVIAIVSGAFSVVLSSS